MRDSYGGSVSMKSEEYEEAYKKGYEEGYEDGCEDAKKEMKEGENFRRDSHGKYM
jgi:flagellar biosynthesis/type III secretory pathway protein FliH